MDTGVIYATIFATFIFCAKPGPGYLMEISRLLSDGLRVSVSIAAGAILGNSIFIWIGGLGLSMIANPTLLLVLQLAGGVYLIGYVLWAIARELRRRGAPAPPPRQATLLGWVAFGLINALMNPVNVSFYTAVLPNYVNQGNALLLLAILNAAAVLFLLLARFLYYGFAISFRRIMQNATCWRWIVIGAHVVFLAVLMVPLWGAVTALVEG